MKKPARTLMIQGTASSVGKSTLVTGLCRMFAQEGVRVAPFKAQNMALNSWVTDDGGEMGRAQVVQADAAGIKPIVEMNPILLKPEGHARSQVIVMGRPLATLEANEYYRQRATQMVPIVERALMRLRSMYDLVIIEGAGSPVEINLAQYDLVNMRIAQLADAPVLLVGDIDRGGIFASLLGTLQLLADHERERVKGLIVNKFRGDLALWRDGERLLAQRSCLPMLGTVPFFRDIHIAEEDSVALDEGMAERQPSISQAQLLEIVIIRLPYLSNYDEFDALAADPRVHLRFVTHPQEFPERPDLIILPGTKNTLSDLRWLWQRELVQYIRLCAHKGCALMGICGGYQMLGERVFDTDGVENAEPGVEAGLCFLPVETFFEPLDSKLTQRSYAQIRPEARYGLLADIASENLQTYQIHAGRTTALYDDDKRAIPALTLDNGLTQDGWLSEDGWRFGCYLHGLFENEKFRHGLLAALMKRRGWSHDFATQVLFDRQTEYDKLAEVMRSALDFTRLKELCNLSDL